jgi:glycosyltransferase involved in cell wall biosynthesis
MERTEGVPRQGGEGDREAAPAPAPTHLAGAHRVTVLVPARNEAGNLTGLIADLRARGLERILVVDNGSTDDTARVAAKAGARVVHEPRAGYGRACLRGLRALDSPGDDPSSAARSGGGDPRIVLFLDGDRSDDPAALVRILEPLLEDRAELTVGVRRGSADAPLRQRGGTGLVTGLARLLHGARLADLGPFRAIRLDALHALGMDDPTWGWTLQMQLRAWHAGMRIVEVPVERRPRAAGRSKISGSLLMSIRVGMRMGWTLLRERFRRPPAWDPAGAAGPSR